MAERQQGVGGWSRLLPFLVMAGAISRLGQYLSRRSFWQDEAMLVLDLRGETAWQLLHHLRLNQAAPPLFLLVERGIGVAWGFSEYALRLAPLLAAIAALVFFALVARRVLEPRAAAIVFAWFAFGDQLIWHASEVKPYSSDVLISVALLLIARPWKSEDARESRPSLLRFAATSAFAAVAIWFSYPAVFVYAGVALASLPAMARGRIRSVSVWCACVLAVLASFSLLFLFAIRPQQSPALQEYWVNDFLNWNHPAAAIPWLGRRILSLAVYASPTGVEGPVLLLLALAGAVFLLRRGSGAMFIALATPLALTILAACIHRYPLDGKRVDTFLIPQLLLLAGIGLMPLFRASDRWIIPRIRWANPHASCAALAVVLIAPGVALASWKLVAPRSRGHIRPAAEYVAARFQPGDVIECEDDRAQLLCYWPGDPAIVRMDGDLADAALPARFWIVVSYEPGHRARRVEKALAQGQPAGKQIDAHIGEGAAAFLFEK